MRTVPDSEGSPNEYEKAKTRVLNHPQDFESSSEIEPSIPLTDARRKPIIPRVPVDPLFYKRTSCTTDVVFALRRTLGPAEAGHYGCES